MAKPKPCPPTTSSIVMAEVGRDLTPLLGTDDLVEQLRPMIPGGLSKRTVYQWLDMGCPHIQLPGARKKLAFVLDEVVAWIMSHRIERTILPSGRRSS
jgi:hypothetical protein